MIVGETIKQEIERGEMITQSRKNLKQELKRLRKQGKIFCRRCVSDDWKNGVYAKDDIKYTQLTLNEDLCDVVRKTNKMGMMIVQEHKHYECIRGHGTCIPLEPTWINPNIQGPSINKVISKGVGDEK